MELQINAIENGSVIDHIDSKNTLKIMEMLGLGGSDLRVTVAFNLKSSRHSSKGMIKIEGRELKKEEIEKIALLAPKATINYIEDFKVINKVEVTPPKKVVGLIKCGNSKCVTNYEDIKTTFIQEEEKYRCRYCERTFDKKDITLK